MENNFLNIKCQSHKLTAAALLLLENEQQENLEELILCAKCLIEKKFQNNKVLIIDEIPEMIQEMKNKKNLIAKASLNKRHSYLSNLKTSINNYKLWIDGLLNKMSSYVQQLLDNIQQQLNEEMKTQETLLINQGEIFELCRFLNNQNNEDKYENNKDQELANYIREQVVKFNQSGQYQKLLTALEINKPQQQLRFSQLFKHEKIILSSDCKTAKSMNDMRSSCLCDQAIPLNGTIAIEFQILKMKYLYIGVCLKEQINRKYELDVSDTAQSNSNWCYFIDETGNTYFHQQDEQQNNFKFCVNDIIRMEVNQENKVITWINKSKNYPTIIKNIPWGQDLYFCFRLSGENEIQII